MARYFVGLTGASGHAYATELVRALVRTGQEVDLAATPAGLLVLRHEMGVDGGPNGERLGEALAGWLGVDVAAGVRTFPCDAVGARAASGTSLTGGVIVAPCSMGTLARVAVGFSSNLVERAADVALKEGRRLVLLPRETPLSEIHLENMLRLARMGAIVLPCAPGFYHHPKTIDDLVRHVVGKVLDRLRIENPEGTRWKGLSEESQAEPPPEAGIESPPEAGKPR